jgi:hypothetical protein
MTFLGHALLFFFAGFTAYLMNSDRGSALGVFLLIALPVAGVYFLGWWAVLTFIVGAFFGGKVFWQSVKTGRDHAED